VAKRASEKSSLLGFEAQLWEAADLLRSNMDPSEYKHVTLGLLFLKYITDGFEERCDALQWLANNVGPEPTEPMSIRVLPRR